RTRCLYGGRSPIKAAVPLTWGGSAYPLAFPTYKGESPTTGRNASTVADPRPPRARAGISLAESLHLLQRANRKTDPVQVLGRDHGLGYDRCEAERLSESVHMGGQRRTANGGRRA